MMKICSVLYFACLLAAVVNKCNVLASNYSCPTWYFYNNITKRCQCGYHLHCHKGVARVLEGYCATTAEGEEDKYYIGPCPYRHAENETDRLYTVMPHPEELDNVMCGPYKRRGLLCGECMKGHGPALYQLDQKCVKCSESSMGYAIISYVGFQLTPLTLLFIIMVIFRINITSGPLYGYIIIWQLGGNFVRPYENVFSYMLSHVSPAHHVFLKAGLVLPSQLFTLDFLFLFKPICISEAFTEIHIHTFYLLSAVYPVFLVIITCILMELHARNCRIIHILWRPFSMILNKTNTTAVTGDAVIQAFASFILLSYFTVYSTMGNIFYSTTVSRITAKERPFYVLYFDPTIKFLSQKHILYIVITAVPFIVVVLTPSLLLTIYPTRIYSRWISRYISTRKRLAITAFCEALHKCFKDGLNGTRDWRSLPGLLVIVPVIFIVFKVIIQQFDYDVSMAGLLFSFFLTFFITYVKPCKSKIANFSLCIHIFFFSIFCVLYHLWLRALYVATESLIAIITIVCFISHFIVLIWACYKMAHHFMIHFGCHCNPTLGVVMTDVGIIDGVKHYIHRRRRGYVSLS